MKVKTIFVQFLLVLSILAAFATAAFAASTATLSLNHTGGTFVLSGSGFNNIGALQVVFRYNNQKLTSPKVIQGPLLGGSFMSANTNVPGTINIAAVNSGGMNGDGSLFTITFNVAGQVLDSDVSYSVVKIIDNNLSDVAVNNQNNSNSDDNSNQGSNTDNSQDSTLGTGTTGTTTTSTTGTTTTGTTTTGTTTTGTTTTGTTAAGNIWLGNVTMPGDTDSSSKDTEKRESTPDQLQIQKGDERAAMAAGDESGSSTPGGKEPAVEEPAAGGKEKFIVNKSIVEAFRSFKGEMSPKALLALFDTDPAAGVRQEPEVALSDGKTKVKLIVGLTSAGKKAPNFALKGAKLVSLKNGDKGSWIIEALPNKNVNKASLTVLQDDVMTEVPITVAQPIDPKKISKNGILDMASFDLFLKERGTEKAPRFDLNNDGVRNYLDDYIFTANYIVNSQLKKPKLSSSRNVVHGEQQKNKDLKPKAKK